MGSEISHDIGSFHHSPAHDHSFVSGNHDLNPVTNLHSEHLHHFVHHHPTDLHSTNHSHVHQTFEIGFKFDCKNPFNCTAGGGVSYRIST